MSTTEHKPKTPSAGTRFFAGLARMHHAQGSGALSYRRVFAGTLAALGILAVLTAAPALAKEIYLQGANGEPPSYSTANWTLGMALGQSKGVMYDVLIGGQLEKFNEAGTPENFSYFGESTVSLGGGFETVAVDNSTEPSDPSKGDFYIANFGNVSNFPNGEIEKYNEAGEFQKSESFAAPPGARGMAVDAKGNLYVASASGEGKVYGFSPTGTPLNSGNPVLVVSLASPKEKPSPYGLAFNSHGDLYVTVNYYNSTSEKGESFTGEFKPEGGVFNPTPIEKELPAGATSYGVAVNQKTNDVFVADYYNGNEPPYYGAVREYNEHGEEIAELRHRPENNGREFWVTYGVAVNEAHSTLYATNFYFDTVNIFHAYQKGTIKLEVAGFGGVTASPKGVTPPEAHPIEYCEESCEEEFEEGSTVTLTASPIERDELASWEGCTDASGATCEVEVGSGVTQVKANFRLQQNTITVNETGTGSGTVKCGAGACPPAFSTGAYVTLNPVPAPHSVFDGWSGACTNTSGPCVIEELTKDMEVTATFDQLKPTISFSGANEVGVGGATLSGQVNPEGASTTCEFEYGTTTLYGSEVPCSVEPGSGAAPVQVSAQLGGLRPSSSYFFRLVATNAGGTTKGEGESVTTATPESCATNVALCVKPSNHFALGTPQAHGSLVIQPVKVPGAGSVTAVGNDIEPANDSIIAAGTVDLKLKLTKAAKAAIKKAKGHKLKVKLKITFTPTGVTPASTTTTVTFHKG